MRLRQKSLRGNSPWGPIDDARATSGEIGKGILTVRSALILVLSTTLGAAAAALTYVAAVQPAVAILAAAIFAGCLTCAGTIRLLNTIIR
jgi:hypothetical protein